jgi:branched-chain amino acid transport system ATP-binding protein
VSVFELKSMTAGYGGEPVLKGLDLAVGEGEFVSIIGPNGAGKSTLFNILTGFIRPSRGQVLFRDRSIIGLKPHQICGRGLVCTFQLVRPFLELTVLDNILVAALNRAPSQKAAAHKAAEVMERLGLSDKSGALAAELNLPSRKKLELARALATGPSLLLLDEVMAGVSPKETDELIELVREVHRQGITILLIEHVMRGVMALSQRVVVINFGQKIAAGTPREIIKNPTVIEAYLGEDFQVAEG